MSTRLGLVTRFCLALSIASAQQPAVDPAATNLHLVGDARLNGSVIHLTPLLPNQTGAAWIAKPQFLKSFFEFEFTFRLSKSSKRRSAGSDGFAFVVQNLGPNAIGGRGSSGGFGIGRGVNPPDRGIPRSIAIFFDTHRNYKEGDPSGNSIGIYTDSDGYFMPRRLAILENAPVRLNDGKPYQVKIHYIHPKLEVALNGTVILSSNISLEAIIGANGQSYVGFTASTGDGFQHHDILDWRLNAPAPQSNSQIGYESVESILRFHDTTCLAGRTLCTPAQPVIEQTAPNRWHIILPAHLPWSASIPNPSQVSAKILNTSGTICWNRRGKNGYSCNGPSGDASGRGKLIQANRDGRLAFSTSANPENYSRNEGYFEFDLELPSP